MDSLTELFSGNLVSVIGKITVLLLIALYLIFSTLIYLQVRSLNVLIQVKRANMRTTLLFFFVVHLVLVLSLFFLSLVIL
jgi:hypothetical protein